MELLKMKKLVLILSLAGFSAFAAENLIKNGDFEKPELESWSHGQTLSDGSKAFTVIEKDGSKVLRCTGDEKSPKNNFITLTQYINPPLKADTAYTIEAKITPKVNYRSGKTFRICIRQANAKNQTLKYFPQMVARLTDKETKTHRFRFTPEKDAAKFYIYVWCSNIASSDEILVDDIKLYPVENE